MATNTRSEAKLVGTNAERLALSLVDLETGTEFDETDTGNTYKVYGSNWYKTRSDGKNIHASAPFSPAAVTGISVTTIGPVASFATDNISKLGMQLEVASAALTNLDLYAKYHADGDFIQITIGTNWSTNGYPVTNSDITTADTSIAIGSHYIDLDVSAYYSIQLWATSGTTSTVDLYAGGING